MSSDKDDRKSPREVYKEETKFYVNADIINARTLDHSGTGVRIETKDPITIHMKIGKDDDTKVRAAKLVWAKKQADGSVSYGLEFSPESSGNTF
jgi:hypothetical protein